jgi:iron(III) transport system substrate-binding protein
MTGSSMLWPRLCAAFLCNVKDMRRDIYLRSLALLAVIATPALAQSGGEWERLVAEAKKEGTVAVGGPIDPAARVYLSRAWQKDFPQIEFNYSVAGGFDWGNRVKAERANGKYLWDVYLNGPNTGIYAFAKEGAFQDFSQVFVLPELKAPKTFRRPMDDMFMDSGKKMLAMFSTPSTIWYNAKKIDPAKVRRIGLEILFDPALKGRIGWSDPRTAGPGSNYAAHLYVLFGKEGLKKIITDNEAVFFARPTQTTEALMRGKLDIVIAHQQSEMERYREAGIEIDLRPVGTDAKRAYLAAGGAILSVWTPAAHPNAARLFANWIMTREQQEGLGKAMVVDSNRADVPPASQAPMRFMPGENYVESQKERMLATRDEAMAYIRELRPQ